MTYAVSCILSGIPQLTTAVMKDCPFQVTLDTIGYEAFLHENVDFVTFRDVQGTGILNLKAIVVFTSHIYHLSPYRYSITSENDIQYHHGEPYPRPTYGYLYYWSKPDYHAHPLAT